MEWMYYLFFFVFGVILGSFFNVVGLRVPEGNFLSSNRSFCPNCKKTLQWYELIPVFSYLIQMGKCRGCYQSIKKLYPIIEILTGICFAVSYYFYEISLSLLFALLVTSLAIIIIVTDSTYYLIPNKILLFFVPFLVVYRIFVPIDPWWSPLAGAVGIFILMVIIIFVSNGGMGAGDMKYYTLLGLAFGYVDILLIFFLSTLYGTVISIMLIITGKAGRKSEIPFGPYISIATITVLFFGEHIKNWYLSFF
ncbi:prepilin peptidase [Gracilibacillus kekensis]|uniref:Type 4 prepilin peptidase 1 Aspartic peptidase. MEROPS family A24A n=1 Tax=Gracilibacillus kekensis TaxID=1027249 RepID=A0A1M7NWJ4_9BACI|nr:A24 family peptidase [Gracilibacillus kekensis]SHN08503.1 type 4 prepilin peptidase 1 Aspartic peptidase. MEROPS family A24A [Gracilibacillus kekensis]